MLTAIITFMIGLFGAALISFGAWMVFPPAGVIAAGVFCLLASILLPEPLRLRMILEG